MTAAVPAASFPLPAVDPGKPAAHPEADRKAWLVAGGIAFTLHAVAIVAVIAAVMPNKPPVPEPVVLVELPPEAGPAAPSIQPATPQQPQPRPDVPQPQIVTPPVDIPPVRAPIPRDAVILPPVPQRTVQQPPAPAAPMTSAVPAPRSGAGPGSSDLPGNDPKSQKLEADYKSLVGSYIRRNKFSPPQSRRAGISGDVKVRFVVHRDGGITDVAVAGSSGHALLDGEAMQFLQHLSPVPSFPRDLRKAEIPLTITLKFQVESK